MLAVRGVGSARGLTGGRVRAVVAALGGVARAGCGAQESPTGGTASASTSASASSSASASASATASPTASPVSKKRAASATRKALLPTSAFEKVGLEVKDPPKEAKWDWFSTCRPYLPSESRQVTGHNGQWKGDGLLVSQTVVAYPDGVAEDIVGEVERTVTCTEYAAATSQFTKVAPTTLPAVDDADATFAWCARQDDEFYVCHSVIAAQDLVSNLWVAGKDKADAEDALAALTKLAAVRIRTQIGG